MTCASHPPLRTLWIAQIKEVASKIFSAFRHFLLSILFSNTMNLCSSQTVRDQGSHPYKTTGKMLVFTFLCRRREDKIFWNEYWQHLVCNVYCACRKLRPVNIDFPLGLAPELFQIHFTCFPNTFLPIAPASLVLLLDIHLSHSCEANCSSVMASHIVLSVSLNIHHIKKLNTEVVDLNDNYVLRQMLIFFFCFMMRGFWENGGKLHIKSRAHVTLNGPPPPPPWLYSSWRTLAASHILSFMWGFVTRNFLQCGVVSTTPNPQPGGPVDYT